MSHVRVAIATKNALKRITSPAYRSAASLSRSIPASTEGVVALRRCSIGENCTVSAVRHPPVGTSLPKLFLQGNPRRSCSESSAGKSSSWCPSSEEYSRASDSDMVTLMTTVQQVMTGLQRTGLLSLWEQFMDWLYGNKGHNPQHS